MNIVCTYLFSSSTEGTWASYTCGLVIYKVNCYKLQSSDFQYSLNAKNIWT